MRKVRKKCGNERRVFDLTYLGSLAGNAYFGLFFQFFWRFSKRVKIFDNTTLENDVVTSFYPIPAYTTTRPRSRPRRRARKPSGVLPRSKKTQLGSVRGVDSGPGLGDRIAGEVRRRPAPARPKRRPRQGPQVHQTVTGERAVARERTSVHNKAASSEVIADHRL